ELQVAARHLAQRQNAVGAFDDGVRERDARRLQLLGVAEQRARSAECGRVAFLDPESVEAEHRELFGHVVAGERGVEFPWLPLGLKYFGTAGMGNGKWEMGRDEDFSWGKTR